MWLGKAYWHTGRRARVYKTCNIPIAFASAILLGFLRIDTLKAVLAKELGDDFLRSDSTFGNASVVLVGELVRSSHFDGV
jgi:hypothetical protein